MASTSHNGKVWAEKTHLPSRPDLSPIQPDYLTCESIGSCDGLDQSKDKDGTAGWTANLTTSRCDVSIDFSNIADVPLPSPGSECVMNSQLKAYARSAPYRRLQHPVDKSLMLSFLLSLCFLIASLVLFCPSIAIILICLPFGLLLRHIFVCCNCCCTKSRTCACCWYHTLRANEIFWLHDTSLNKTVIQCLCTLEEGLDIRQIRDVISTRLVGAEGQRGKLKYPRFTQKILPLYSGYTWINDPDFCIDNHIYPMPGTIRTNTDLKIYLAEQANVSLPLDRPLWEIQILPDLGELHDTVLLLRIHPCVSDGISLMRILTSSMADNHTLCNLKPRFGESAYTFNVMRTFFVGPIVFLYKWLFRKSDSNMFRGPEISGRKIVAWSEPISMSVASRVKLVTRSTLNDVFLALISGSLRTYLQVVGVSNPYDLRATIPVDLRTDDGHIKMGNKYALVDIKLPTNTEGIIPRLWELKHRMDDLKNSAYPVIVHCSQSVLWYMLPEYLYHKIWKGMMNKSSCYVSNLQGPENVIRFASKQVKDIIYWIPPRNDVALSISFLTYADHVRMAVVADQSIMPNPQILTKEFIFQLETLSQLLINRRIPGEQSGRRMEVFLHDDSLSHDEASIAEIQSKMAEVQQELQDLKYTMDINNTTDYSREERELTMKVEELKDEFKDLLAELRRRKTSEGSAVISDEEDDDDVELRRPYRKRSYSGTSRRSIHSCTSSSRAIGSATSPPSSQSQHTPPPTRSHTSTPSSPTLPLSHGKDENDVAGSPTVLTHEKVVGTEAADGGYSPQVERKFSFSANATE